MDYELWIMNVGYRIWDFVSNEFKKFLT